MDKMIDADEKVKVLEDFGLIEQGSTHDLLNDMSSSNVPLSMYRVVCDLANDSSHLSEKKLIGNGGNVAILNILLSSFGFSRDLDHDLRHNSISLGWRRNGVMLFHPTLVVTPEVESSKLWWLNICGTGVGKSGDAASLRRLRIRPSNSTECERWLNRISAATCLATSTEMAMFLDSQVRSVRFITPRVMPFT